MSATNSLTSSIGFANVTIQVTQENENLCSRNLRNYWTEFVIKIVLFGIGLARLVQKDDSVSDANHVKYVHHPELSQ